MRVGVHLESLRPGEIGGMESYVRDLLEWLPAIDRDVTLVLFCAEHNIGIFAEDKMGETHLLSEKEFFELDADALLGKDLDVWFCPLLTLEPADPGLPSVVTIPDMQHAVHPEFFSAEVLDWRRRHYARSAADADRILTLSSYSKQQIVDHLGVAEEKVVPTYLDASRFVSSRPFENPSYLAEVRSRLALPDRYFYYPANDWPHKNHRVLFEALALFRSRGVPPPPLLLSGAQIDSSADLRQDLERLNLEEEVRFLGYVPTELLPGIYAQAMALVFPSLFEGFGIPVLEAMRSGCPVICSHSTSLPEVGGNAVLYFDPTSPEELFAHLWTMAGLAANSQLRRKLTAAGVKQARSFSWRRTATETLDVLKQAAARPPCAVSTRVDGELPTMSIITPSYQQGPFLELTVKSVLEQGYPDLQHLVMDGGSSDETLAILEQYKRLYPKELEFVSEDDNGQAHAVNKGLERARGEVIGWLNSDDTYEPGVLKEIGRIFAEDPSCEVVYGGGTWIASDDTPIAPYPTRRGLSRESMEHDCEVCQPTVFWRRSVVERGYRLDESLQTALDYDLWIRLSEEIPFRFVNRLVANSRIHADNKTLKSRHQVYREIFATVKRHFGRVSPAWILGKAHFAFNGSGSFFHPPDLTWKVYCLALLYLVRHNWSQPRFLWCELSRGEGMRWRREVTISIENRIRDRRRQMAGAVLRTLRWPASFVGETLVPRFLESIYPAINRATFGVAKWLLLRLGAFVSDGSATQAYFARPELFPDGWCGREAAFERIADRPALGMALRVWIPLDYLPSPFSMNLTVDGHRHLERRIDVGGEHWLFFAFDTPVPAGAHRIEIRTNGFYVPHRILRNDDHRPLAWNLRELEFREC